MEKEPFWIIYALRLWNDLFLLYEISKGAHYAYGKTAGAMRSWNPKLFVVYYYILPGYPSVRPRFCKTMIAD